MINAASADMAVILRALYEAALTVDRDFTEIRLNYDISVPDISPDEATFRGGYPWYVEHDGSLRFYGLKITLPHTHVEVTGYPSEIRLYLGLRPHDRGFTVTADIEVDLLQPLYNFSAGEHEVMKRMEEEETTEGAVAAISRCRDAFAEHYNLFDSIGFPLR
jgi:hypothetical protein